MALDSETPDATPVTAPAPQPGGPAPAPEGTPAEAPATESDSPAEEAPGEGEASVEPEVDATGFDYEGLDLDVDGFRVTDLRACARDAMLTRFRATPKPWERMSEEEQADCAAAFDMAAGEIVRGVMAKMLAFEMPHAVVRLGKCGFVGGDKPVVEGKFTTPGLDLETVQALAQGSGRLVTIVMADSGIFERDHRTFRPDPDQPSLPIDDPEVPDPQTREEVEADVAAMGGAEAMSDSAAEVAADGSSDAVEAPVDATEVAADAAGFEAHLRELEGGSALGDSFEAPEAELAAQKSRSKIRAARQASA